MPDPRGLDSSAITASLQPLKLLAKMPSLTNLSALTNLTNLSNLTNLTALNVAAALKANLTLNPANAADNKLDLGISVPSPTGNLLAGTLFNPLVVAQSAYPLPQVVSSAAYTVAALSGQTGSVQIFSQAYTTVSANPLFYILFTLTTSTSAVTAVTLPIKFSIKIGSTTTDYFTLNTYNEASAAKNGTLVFSFPLKQIVVVGTAVTFILTANASSYNIVSGNVIIVEAA